MQNNKIYVGKTTTCIRDRFSKHVYEANTPNTKGYSFILHKAMRKYGIENFQIEQIEDAAEAISVDRSCISRCCSGKKKSCRGFLWKFMATGKITSEEVTKIYG